MHSVAVYDFPVIVSPVKNGCVVIPHLVQMILTYKHALASPNLAAASFPQKGHVCAVSRPAFSINSSSPGSPPIPSIKKRLCNGLRRSLNAPNMTCITFLPLIVILCFLCKFLIVLFKVSLIRIFPACRFCRRVYQNRAGKTLLSRLCILCGRWFPRFGLRCCLYLCRFSALYRPVSRFRFCRVFIYSPGFVRKTPGYFSAVSR